MLRAGRLLAEIGDARGRFPTADSLACLAGVAPSTRQSGKVKAVTFRWSADHQLRDALCDFAGDSRHANPWAADLYNRARALGHDHPHAVRILGRAWANIIWRCWQDNVATTPPNTEPSKPFSTRRPRPPKHPGVDTEQLIGDRSCVGQRPGKPVELGDHQRVAFSAGRQGFAQAGPVSVGAGQAVIDVNPSRTDTQCRQTVVLGSEVLLVGGATCVTDEKRRGRVHGRGV